MRFKFCLFSMLIAGYVILAAQIFAAPIKIMPLGDSITNGNGEGAYRTELYRLLTAGGVSFDFVGTQGGGPSALPDKDNEGHHGACIGPDASQWGNLSDNLSTYFATKDPQIILLHIGTNEFWNRTSNDGVDVTKTAERLSAFIDKIYTYKPNAVIFVATLIACRYPNTNYTTYNQKIPAVVQAKFTAGKKVYFVDMHAESGVAYPSDLGDDVHPNVQGYAKMAKVWDDHLDAYFAAATPIAAALNKPDLSPTPTAAKITLQSIGGAPFSLAIRHNNSVFDISGRAMHSGMMGVSKK